MRHYCKYLGLILLFLITTDGFAQDKLTEHTFKLNQGASPGKGKLEDVAWLVGSWQGTAFGEQFEEVWNAASAGTMVGMFKLFDKEKGINFYELMLLKEEGDSLELWVKHFSADFKAWEEKEDYVKFKLVRLDKDAIHFSSLSFYRKSNDKINGYIVMKHKDGSKTEHLIAYQRVFE